MSRIKLELESDELDFLRDAVEAWENEGYYNMYAWLDTMKVSKFEKLAGNIKDKLGIG